MSRAARDDPAALLAELYDDDRREHAAVPPAGTFEYQALRERDRARRALAVAAIRRLRDGDTPSPADLFHAAWLLNHGDLPADAEHGYHLASESAERSHPGARWLAAAAFDRWCMYEGRPQKYGTQFVPDGKRYRLWDVEPSTTDEDRAACDVPPLAVQIARAEEMTRRDPQPPMEGAPGWLTDAIRRWRNSGG